MMTADIILSLIRLYNEIHSVLTTQGFSDFDLEKARLGEFSEVSRITDLQKLEEEKEKRVLK